MQQKYDRNEISVRLFLANTDPALHQDVKFMIDAAASVNKIAGYKAATVFEIANPPLNHAHGYDIIDNILDDLLETSDCTHLLFTEGGSAPKSNWLDSIAEGIKSKKVIIGLSYHRVIHSASAKFLPRAVLAERRTIDRANARFLPHGPYTAEMARRTAFFFEVLTKRERRSTIKNVDEHKTLVLISTCNHVGYTVKFIESLKAVSGEFDLLVVDDASVDGTPEILTRMGVQVITKDLALGLTHSWNMAYGIFKEGYRQGHYVNMIIANNDLLVGEGGVDLIRQALLQHPFVVPMSTSLGVGHNPAQSIAVIYNLTEGMALYVNEHGNHKRVQAGLTARVAARVAECEKKKCATDKSGLLFTPTPKKFNGFFFAFRAPEIFLAEYAPGVLFDTDSIMVGQEDALIQRLRRHGVTPMISHDVFVFHFKSVTVKAAGYVAGSEHETREDLSHYHPELKNSSVSVTFGQHFTAGVLNADVLNQGSVTLGSGSSTVLALAISDPITNPAAGDIMTAHEFGDHVESLLGWTVRYLGQPDWYDLRGVDVVIAVLPQYNPLKITHKKLTLVTMAWPRNWFERWANENPGYGLFDLVLSSSEKGKEYLERQQPFDAVCTFRCVSPKLIDDAQESMATQLLKRISTGSVHSKMLRPPPVEVLRIATNAEKFLSSELSPDLSSDYVFTGSYWNAYRKIMDFNPDHVPNFTGAVYGSGWLEAKNVSASFKSICRGKLDYTRMGSVYKSTKIVVDDANHVTAPWGSVNSRVFDALAAGALVVSNGLIGAQEIFGDVLPTYDSMAELETLLQKFLANPTERKAAIRKLQNMVLRDQTYEMRAWQLYEGMDKHGLVPVQGRVNLAQAQNETKRKVHSALHRVCAIMRTHPGQAGMLGVPLVSLTQQQYLNANDDISIRVFLMNTDPVAHKETQFMTDAASYANSAAGYEGVLVMEASSSPSLDHAYGYDATDTMLDNLLDASDCTHFLFTNGDNFYNSEWLTQIAGPLKAGKHLIAWDFTTHHERDGTNVIHVKFVRSFVDLGAVLVRRRAIEQAGARFVPLGPFTGDFFARDWWFFKGIYDAVGESGVAYVHQVLFMHQ
jgi:hypothetical protein